MHEKLLIVENISHEGPGLLETILHEQGIGFELCDLSRGELIPDTARYAGVIVLGGPQSANDTSSQILHELQRIRETLDAGIPFLGICLGLQLMVKAAGGTVVPCRIKETGFHEPDGEPFTVRLTAEGLLDPLFSGLPDNLRVFQLHGETVVPTEEMTLLGTGKGCRHQVMRVGRNAWGLQCHFEMTRQMFEEWTLTDHDLMSMKRDELLTEFDRIHAGYTETGRTILRNFLEACGFVMH
jgi:GMP synthase (glutamine-hydrolysing)